MIYYIAKTSLNYWTSINELFLFFVIQHNIYQSNVMSLANVSGKCTDKGNEHRNNTDNISGLPNNASAIVLRRQRLDDSGNDSGHNSIMTSKFVSIKNPLAVENILIIKLILILI